MKTHAAPMRLLSLIRSPLWPLLLLPALALAQVSVNISVNVAPPELPSYEQPPIPDDGYIWTPGYWAWSADIADYYWVPGTWVEAPQPDYLWTPGYWGAEGAAFVWHTGYWGPHVGFYGGVNYGYGYGGSGYEGGYWRGGHLYYNRSVNNIGSSHVTNVYEKTVVNNVTVNRVSYNGGNGVRAQPSPADLAASRDRHINFTPAQRQHEQAARGMPDLRARANAGHPPIAATPRPGALSGAGAEPAKRGGTFSVVHASPPASAPEPQQGIRAAQPPRESTPQAPRQDSTRPEREVQPRQELQSEASRPAQPPHQDTPRQHPARPEGQAPTRPEGQAARQAQPQAPHPQAAGPRPTQTRPAPRAEPHAAPPAHTPEHQGNEHHYS